MTYHKARYENRVKENFMKKLRGSLVVLMLIAITMFSGCKKESSKLEYSKGTIDGDTFESEFLNLKFTTPKGYTMFPEEVMNEYVQFTSDIIYKDKDQQVIDYAEAVAVYEMMCAESVTNSPNVNIVIENLLGREISLDDYIEASKQQLLGTGIDYTFGDTTEEVEIAGEKYMVLDCVGNYSGQELLQQMYIRKVGDRMMLLTFTYTEDTVEGKDALLAGFTAFK